MRNVRPEWSRFELGCLVLLADWQADLRMMSAILDRPVAEVREQARVRGIELPETPSLQMSLE